MSHFFSRRARLALAWFSFIVHVVALAFMLLALQFGLLLGTETSRRAVIIALGPIWQIGWFCWMLASLALVLLFLAWADTLESKAWGILAVGLCLAGAAIDWIDETVLIGVIPRLAANDPLNLFPLWEYIYRVVSIGLANGLYTASGIVLNALAFQTRGYPRWLAWLGVPLWAFSIALSAFGLANAPVEMTLASAGIFAFFLPWMLLLGYGWLQKSDDAMFPPSRVSFVNTLRSMIPRHPVPMTTVFRECFLVNFAVSPEVMRPLVPAPLELELSDGCAYLSIVLAEMQKMRPAFLPKTFGITYNQVVYRIVVRYRGERGVYFLRSDADHPLMSLAGELLTFFHFNLSRIAFARIGDTHYFDLTSRRQAADIHAAYSLATARKTMPPSSHFGSLAEAQEFLVQLFAAFSYDDFTDNIGIVRIRRGEWKIDVVDDTTAFYPLMQDSKCFPCGSAKLDSIFYVKELLYYWRTLQITSRAQAALENPKSEAAYPRFAGSSCPNVFEPPTAAYKVVGIRPAPPRFAGSLGPAPLAQGKVQGFAAEISERSGDPARSAGRNPKWLPFPRLTLYRIVFYAAALYNLLWGAFTVLAPNFFFDALGIARPNYPFLWAGVGLFVAAYAPAYFLVARDPPRYPMLVLVGYLGKLLGPIGWLATVLRGELPLASLYVILFNDLIWWPFFLLYLYDVCRINRKTWM